MEIRKPAAGQPATPTARPPAAAAEGARPAPIATDGVQLSAAAAAPLGWVRAQGDRLVDAAGKPVQVRGINLGGWLVQEPWMMPLVADPGDGPKIADAATVWRTLASRFGEAEMAKLRDEYRDAWLTDADFARIKAAGLTTVRLPFTYANLQEPGGFARLDWAIERAAKHGLYTILDLHGAPGGQSEEMHTGEAGQNRFFEDPREVDKAVAMWRDVARRYADRPEVLGYDLLNEPMGAKSAKQLYDVQDRLYKAVREVDPRHLVIMEDGYRGIDTFPPPGRYGWDNVAYSIHQYAFDAKGPADHLKALDGMLAKADRVRQARGVPVYVGEVNVPGAEADTLGRAVDRLHATATPYSLWTYKVVMPGAHQRNVWGLWANQREAQPLDVRHDSLPELRRKIGLMRTEHLQPLPGGDAMFRAEGPAPARTPARGLARLWLLAQDQVMRRVAAVVDLGRRAWEALRGPDGR